MFNTLLAKAGTAIGRISIILKSDLTDKMKCSLFQVAVVSILQYGCTTWTITKRIEKKFDGNYIRMLRAILNKSCRQHPTKQQPNGHQPSIKKTIKIRRTRHAVRCWRSRDKLITDVYLWSPTHGRAKVEWTAPTYIQQLWVDTGCSPEDLPEAMEDREEWRESQVYIWHTWVCHSVSPHSPRWVCSFIYRQKMITQTTDIPDITDCFVKSNLLERTIGTMRELNFSFLVLI